jgi:hypothetical protein
MGTMRSKIRRRIRRDPLAGAGRQNAAARSICRRNGRSAGVSGRIDTTAAVYAADS